MLKISTRSVLTIILWNMVEFQDHSSMTFPYYFQVFPPDEIANEPWQIHTHVYLKGGSQKGFVR